MTSMRQVTSAQGEQLARECALPPLACRAHIASGVAAHLTPCTLAQTT
jgi:hypothetical protein